MTKAEKAGCLRCGLFHQPLVLLREQHLVECAGTADRSRRLSSSIFLGVVLVELIDQLAGLGAGCPRVTQEGEDACGLPLAC